MLEGKIIAIEGPDFSGKTTLINNLITYFTNKGIAAKTYRQPGATPLGLQCRNLLFNNPEVPEMDNLSERLLFAIDHVEFTNVLKKHQEDKDALVICDRWSPLSNLVYGINGRGVDRWKILHLNQIIHNDIKPDLIIIIEMTLDECLKRYAAAKNREINKLDKQGVEFKRAILHGYRGITNWDLVGYPGIVRIDGVKTEPEVFGEAVAIIEKLV